MATRLCAGCGVEIRGRSDKRFCSNGCFRKNRSNPAFQKTCPNCGISFIANHRTSIHCSRKCKSEWYYKHGACAERSCNQCGKRFRPHHKNGSGVIFCSRKCSILARAQEIRGIKNCRTCGAEFHISGLHPSTALYCSYKCTKDANTVFDFARKHAGLNSQQVPEELFRAKIKQITLHRELKKQQQAKLTR